MLLLPRESTTYRSALSASEIYSRLQTAVEPDYSANSSLDVTKPYRGEVSASSFAIRRVIGYRNSFLPRITGTIHATTSVTEIQVRMELHRSVLAFFLLWNSFAVAMLVLVSWMGSFPFMPLLLLVFGYSITTVAFQYEARRSKEDFRRMFEAGVRM